MLHRLAQGGETTEQARPSGFTFKQNAFSTNNGGSIPHNLLIAQTPNPTTHTRRAVVKTISPFTQLAFPQPYLTS